MLQVNIYKDPVTDPGKKSKKGRLSLEVDKDGSYFTSTENTSDSATVRLIVKSNSSTCRHEELFDHAPSFVF